MKSTRRDSLPTFFLQLYLILSLVPQTSAFTSIHGQRCSLQTSNHYESHARSLHQTHSISESRADPAKEVAEDAVLDKNSYPRRLVRALDLFPFIHLVALHTATLRGYDAMMSLVWEIERDVPEPTVKASELMIDLLWISDIPYARLCFSLRPL